MANWSTDAAVPCIDVQSSAVLRLGTHVIALFQSPDELWAEDLDLLSKEDRQQHCAYRNPTVANEFAAGRIALYHAGKTLGFDTRQLRIKQPPNGGKPRFCQDEPGFHFSITHTDGLAACIASRQFHVGCDCERWDRDINTASLSWVLDIGGASMRDCLLSWTRFEALIKLGGYGLQEIFAQGSGPYAVADFLRINVPQDGFSQLRTLNVNGTHAFSYSLSKPVVTPNLCAVKNSRPDRFTS